jgi:WD40 repeat protein
MTDRKAKALSGNSENWKNAIARVEVTSSGEKIIGTAFLVRGDSQNNLYLALTAMHVVADIGKESPSLYDGRIMLYFSGGDSTPAEIFKDRYCRKEDWVLLKCLYSQSTRPVITLSRKIVNEDRWKSFGFAEDTPEEGIDLTDGKVASLASSVDEVLAYALSSKDLANDVAARGLSGAPVIVKGRAVGLLRAALLRPDPAGENRPLLVKAGRVYACPAYMILDKNRDCLRDISLPNPPDGDEPTGFWQRSSPAPVGFVDRNGELDHLRSLLLQKKHRVVCLKGPKGIGTTTLARDFGARMEKEKIFERGLWVDLSKRPSLETILDAANTSQKTARVRSGDAAHKLLAVLKKNAILLVLDNLEAILEDRSIHRTFREDFRDYDKFLNSATEMSGQSRILITSAVVPNGYQIEYSAVQLLSVGGLKSATDVERFLLGADLHLYADKDCWRRLHAFCDNPGVLHMLGSHIARQFEGNIRRFLDDGSVLPAEVVGRFEEQWQQLSRDEATVVLTLAAERTVVAWPRLTKVLRGGLTDSDIRSALLQLEGRSLLENYGKAYRLASWMGECVVSNRLVSLIEADLVGGTFKDLDRFLLLRASNEQHIRDEQLRSNIRPVLDRLRMTVGDEATLEEKLRATLAELRTNKYRGYAAGNVLNLLVGLRADLTKLDCSGLALRHAYLAEVRLQDADFTGADLDQTVFAEPLSPTLGVSCIRANKGEDLLATGHAEGVVCLRNLDDGVVCQELRGKGHSVWGVCFDPTGQWLVSGTHDGTIDVWDPRDGSCPLQLRMAENDNVTTLAWSHDGEWLASGGERGEVNVWQLGQEGQLSKAAVAGIELGHHTGRLHCVRFHPKVLLLASAGGENDCSIRIWDLETKKCLRILKDHGCPVLCLAFSADGTRLASSDAGHTVILWDLAVPAVPRKMRTFKAHENEVSAVVFCGNELASASHDCTVRIWDLSGETPRCRETLVGHTGKIHSLAFHAPCKVLCSASEDMSVRLWDAAAGTCKQEMKGSAVSVLAVAFEREGRVVAGGSDGVVRAFSPDKEQAVAAVTTHAGAVRGLAISCEGSLLVTVGEDGSVRVRDLEHDCFLPERRELPAPQCVALDKNGRMLAAISKAKLIYLWDRTNRGSAHRFGEKAPVVAGGSVAFHPTQSVLAFSTYAAGDHIVRLLNFESGEDEDRLTGHTNWIYAIAFSPSGDCLATGSGDHTVRLWNAGTRSAVVLNEHKLGVTSVAFSSDGSLLASGSKDCTVKIWGVQTKQCLATLDCDSRAVNALAFHPDRREFVCGLDDGTIHYRALDDSGWTLRRKWQLPRPYEGLLLKGATFSPKRQSLLPALRALGAVTDES